jgi:Xaa-Pro aminopeptidase
MASLYATRVAAVRRAAAKAGAESLLVTHQPNVLYLCGFTGSSGALLVGRGRPVLFTDGRYAIQARAEAPGAAVVIQGGSLWAAVGQRLRAAKLKRAGFEPSHLSVTQAQDLRRAAGNSVRWTPVPSVVEDLRSIKSPEEIALIRRAARLISRVFEETLPFVKPGVREIELAAEIEYRIKSLGASGPSFETIVASGRRAALPHARPTVKRLRKNELVVFDQGAILAHYCSDLTRTVFLGRAPSRIRRWYQAVGEAQAAAREALRPGATAGSVDAAARRVLEGYGFEKYFTHSLGHGIGLEIHEDPRLAKGQERRVETGQVVTLEPGVYVEGVGGIRIEDDVAVHARGIEVLTNAPRELLEL